MKFEKKYPALFKEVIWPWGPTRARFVLLDQLPPSQRISNVNIVPQVGNSWLIYQHEDLSWDIPGGTVEKGEHFIDTLHRELIEEVGAKPISFSVFGAWHCFSLASEPYRPHLPYPEYYRIVGVGRVEVVQSPTNPLDGEKILAVALVSMNEAIEKFEISERYDLAQLYQLASEITLNNLRITIDVM